MGTALPIPTIPRIQQSHDVMKCVRVLVPSLLLGSTLCLPLRGEFIQPVAVHVTNGEATADSLINGLGLDDGGVGSPASVHNNSAGEMWSAIGSIRESASFDLGVTTNLTKVYIWNYSAPNATDVGMREVEVRPVFLPVKVKLTPLRSSQIPVGVLSQAYELYLR